MSVNPPELVPFELLHLDQIIYNQVRDWMLNISNECSSLYLRSSPSPNVPISILGVV